MKRNKEIIILEEYHGQVIYGDMMKVISAHLICESAA